MSLHGKVVLIIGKLNVGSSFLTASIAFDHDGANFVVLFACKTTYDALHELVLERSQSA